MSFIDRYARRKGESYLSFAARVEVNSIILGLIALVVIWLWRMAMDPVAGRDYEVSRLCALAYERAKTRAESALVDVQRPAINDEPTNKDPTCHERLVSGLLPR